MKRIAVFLSAACLLVLCGCKTDYSEIERGYLVTAIGFSKQEKVEKVYIEAISSSYMSEESSKRVVLTGQGDTVASAFENLKSQLIKPLFFEQLGSAVFNTYDNQEEIEFLKNIPNINYGIYLIKTDDMDTLFEGASPNGILGYDIIGIIDTHKKEVAFYNQLYQINRDNFVLPTINFANENLVFVSLGEDI